MSVEQVVSGHELHEFLFYLQHRLARGDAGAVADPENMRINRHGGLTESGIEHYVRGFATHARQCFQSFTSLWHFAAVVLNQ